MPDWTKGNEILAKAKEHYKNRLTGELSSMEVPEWGCTIYYPASISLLKMKRIQKALDEGSADACAQIIIENSFDENGNKLFSQGMKDDMMSGTDSAVVNRIAEKLSSIFAKNINEDIEGNLQGTPKFDSGTGSPTDSESL